MKIREIDWAAIIGSALVLAFCLVVLVPLYRQYEYYQDQTSNYANAKIDVRKPDERLADYTLWLERFTALLAVTSIFTLIFLLRADATARIAANAARDAADAAATQTKAAIGVELPRFLLRDISPHVGGVIFAGTDFRPVVSLANHGRTVATIIADAVEVRVERVLPSEPEYQQRFFRQAPLGTAIANGEDYHTEPSARSPWHLSQSYIDDVISGERSLWVYGFIRYRDFLSDVHMLGFCARMQVQKFQPGPPQFLQQFRFVDDGPTQYTYDIYVRRRAHGASPSTP